MHALNTDYITHSYAPQTLAAINDRLAGLERCVAVRGRALDLGCGTGALCSLLAGRPVQVFAGDYSAVFLKELRRRMPEGNAIQLEAAELPIKSAALDYVQRERSAWLEMARILRRGGHAQVRISGLARLLEILKGPGAAVPFRIGIVCLIALSTALAALCGYRWKPAFWSHTFHTRASLHRVIRASGFEILSLSTQDGGRMYDLVLQKK
jgi:SAM-dependent methyltransferase